MAKIKKTIALGGIMALLCLMSNNAGAAEGCVEKGPQWSAWSGSCPSVVSNGSVTPSQICQSNGATPTLPMVVVPVYSPSNIWIQTGTYNCTNTIATNTVNVTFSVGAVSWVPAIPATLTNAFTSTAYVTVTSSDTNKCPAPGQVSVGSCSWCISSTSTNCVNPGYIQFTNATMNPTNGCLGSAFSATVTPVVSNSMVVLTTTCPCSTNAPIYVTNYPAPGVISNWWVVSGPGSYSNSGSGLSANFTPTNGGNGTVTIYEMYSNSIPCSTNAATVSVSLSFNVIQITNLCVATIPTNRTRTEIGVGEGVMLGLAGPPSGTFTWSTTAGGLSTTNGTQTTLTAQSNTPPGSATVTVDYQGGSCQLVFTVDKPTGYASAVVSNDSFPVNTAGAGMFIDVWIVPTNVSFSQVQIMEIPATNNINVTGYFTNHAPGIHNAANGAGKWIQLNAYNMIQDHASGGGYPQTWSAGSKTWPIPAVWQVVGDTNTNNLPWSNQIFTMAGSNGTFTIQKFGRSVTRTTNDVSTN